VKPADGHIASAADRAARLHDTAPPRAARPVLHAVGVVASGLLALLLLVCAVLPLLRMAGDVPHGFERQPVLSQAALPENRDPNLRVSTAMVDLDDSYGSVAALRIPLVTKLRADRLAMPRILTGLATRALAPLERPPRLGRPA
jgi:hypothetical protein